MESLAQKPSRHTDCLFATGAGAGCKNTGTLALTATVLSILGAAAFLVARHFKPTMAKPLAIGAGVSGTVAVITLLAGSCFKGMGAYKERQSGNYALYYSS